jgi:hypothetical protein
MGWKNSLAIVLTLATLILTSGCGFLAPQPDRSRFYVLTTLSQLDGEPSDPKSMRGVVVGLGPIRFPDYLNRSQLISRSSENQIRISPLDYWAEPLTTSFGRVLSENLSQLLGTHEIVHHPWFVTFRPQYEIPMNVLRFETRHLVGAELVARWTIREGETRKVVHVSESSIRVPVEGAGAGAEVKALSRALEELSVEIATALYRAHASRGEKDLPS